MTVGRGNGRAGRNKWHRNAHIGSQARVSVNATRGFVFKSHDSVGVGGDNAIGDATENTGEFGCYARLARQRRQQRGFVALALDGDARKVGRHAQKLHFVVARTAFFGIVHRKRAQHFAVAQNRHRPTRSQAVRQGEVFVFAPQSAGFYIFDDHGFTARGSRSTRTHSFTNGNCCGAHRVLDWQRRRGEIA